MMSSLLTKLFLSSKPQKKIRLKLDGPEKLTVLNEHVVKIGTLCLHIEKESFMKVAKDFYYAQL